MAFLSAATVVQPLIHRWYAVPQVAAPHTGALNLAKRHLPALRSYVASPEAHARALASPGMFGAPFISPGRGTPEDIEALLADTLAAGGPRLRLAAGIDAARVLLAERADGGALGDLYRELPASLRGLSELVYDTAGNASIRFFEPLLYRSEAAQPEAQVVSLLPRHDPAQPFVYSSPVLPCADRVDLRVPFAAPELDALFAGRVSPVEMDEIASLFDISDTERNVFGSLFTETAPRPYQAAAAGEVRARYFGHACVLLDYQGFTVMTDPTIGYDADGHQHYTIGDLPDRIDVVVLSHGHSDHFSLETLLQLRRRIGTIVVPQASGGTLADIGLRVMLEHFGFRNVIELADLQTAEIGPALITAMPFLGEHGDLDIRAKMVPLVRIAGRGFLFATDTSPVDPGLYDSLTSEIGPVDALYIGLECVGAPMSWLYGPLLDAPVSREHDVARSLRGSFAGPADQIARRFGARQVFVYALGIEPWLKHLTGCWYDPEAEQLKQTRLLADLCGERGVPAELLYITAEHSWPVGTESVTAMAGAAAM